MDRWSEAYVGTYNYSNKNEMQELTTLRNTVKIINRWSREQAAETGKKATQLYVKCQGRSASGQVKRSGRYYYSMPLDVADSVDAYIYERNAYGY
jgi:hypothetical protein